MVAGKNTHQTVPRADSGVCARACACVAGQTSRSTYARARVSAMSGTGLFLFIRLPIIPEFAIFLNREQFNSMFTYSPSSERKTLECEVQLGSSQTKSIVTVERFNVHKPATAGSGDLSFFFYDTKRKYEQFVHFQFVKNATTIEVFNRFGMIALQRC
ncbi:hypothetical protein J6590_039745 [Homalodisca vitripennis]|nr:hypothetical protein J6590_039745 [Homalodisca vitripennis]